MKTFADEIEDIVKIKDFQLLKETVSNHVDKDTFDLLEELVEKAPSIEDFNVLKSDIYHL